MNNKQMVAVLLTLAMLPFTFCQAGDEMVLALLSKGKPKFDDMGLVKRCVNKFHGDSTPFWKYARIKHVTESDGSESIVWGCKVVSFFRDGDEYFYLLSDSGQTTVVHKHSQTLCVVRCREDKCDFLILPTEGRRRVLESVRWSLKGEPAVVELEISQAGFDDREESQIKFAKDEIAVQRLGPH